jgi:hypothetical protein
MVENHDRGPVFTDRKSYDKRHKMICEKLHLAEVHAPRMYAQSTQMRADGKVVTVCYNQQGAVLSSTDSGNPALIGRNRFQGIIIPESDSRIRVSKFVYLSHVLTQCGLREKAIRPLWRLLRIGYKIRLTNFKKLVSKVALACGHRLDFTRDLAAPAKGLQHIPRFDPGSKPFLLKGIFVPRWTKKPVFTGNIRDYLD